MDKQRRRRGRSDEVRLRDPDALRALAHPARLLVVDELYQGNERTSSELAELTGLSPSAMSYHLRALERWGIVERGEPREPSGPAPGSDGSSFHQLTSKKPIQPSSANSLTWAWNMYLPV